MFAVMVPALLPASDDTNDAIFAGGCFWCMEPPFDQLNGVVATTAGYIGGSKPNPTYNEVSSGKTGHTEAVKITYRPAAISYQELLEIFWVNIDPVAVNRQFCDRGSQYRAGIFYLDDKQERLAQASKIRLETSGQLDKPVTTEITKAGTFYPAEDYHQDYYLKNAFRYKYYRYSCGRDERLKELWGK